jgi:hypothetical protein
MIAALAAFFASHIAPARPPIRRFFVERLGKRMFTALDARDRREWGQDFWARRAALTSITPFADVAADDFRLGGLRRQDEEDGMTQSTTNRVIPLLFRTLMGWTFLYAGIHISAITPSL